MILLTNKRASFDYEIKETYEAGIQLKGFEVKSLKNKKGSIIGAYGVIKDNEVFLINMDIPPYQPNNTPSNYDPKRSRKLLLKKSEIKYLIGKISQGLTILPLKVYTKRQKIKVELGLGKIKKKIDKREIIKKREAKKEIERKIKEKIKERE